MEKITADNFIDRYEGEGRCGKLTNEDLELIIGALKSSPLVNFPHLPSPSYLSIKLSAVIS